MQLSEMGCIHPSIHPSIHFGAYSSYVGIVGRSSHTEPTQAQGEHINSTQKASGWNQTDDLVVRPQSQPLGHPLKRSDEWNCSQVHMLLSPGTRQIKGRELKYRQRMTRIFSRNVLQGSSVLENELWCVLRHSLRANGTYHWRICEIYELPVY